MRVLQPSALALPDSLLRLIPPRPEGFDMTRELFPRNTGMAFDALTPAVVAAQHLVGILLTPDRAARMAEQHALDPTLPGLDDVIDTVVATAFGAAAATPYQAEIKRAVERVVVDQLTMLAGSAPMADVRALANYALQRRLTVLSAPPTGDPMSRANTAIADGRHPAVPEPPRHTRRARRGAGRATRCSDR